MLLAEAQSQYGLVSEQEAEDLRRKMDAVDLERSLEIEKRIKHHVMAEIKAYAEQTPTGGGKIHLGATSADIEDNAEMMRMKQALNIVLTRLVNCLSSLAETISKHKALACMGWTHLQPAEPTTVGYRFANYAQDLVLDIQLLENLSPFTRGKGFKGAVGTSASYKALLKGKAEPAALEETIAKKASLDLFPVATQTYPRKADYTVLSALASIAQSAYRFAFDVRILQCPAFGEVLEPMREEQVGSSTMAFKRNPVNSERICSLARYVSVLPTVAFMNASGAILERTLDDSASRRIMLPEGFLAVDEILLLYNKIAAGIRFYPQMIKRNLDRFGSFSGTEALLLELAAKGEDRQKMHEKIRDHSFRAWEVVMEGKENPLADMLKKDPVVSSKIPVSKVDQLLDPCSYTGDAAERCERFLSDVINPLLHKYRSRISRQPSTTF